MHGCRDKTFLLGTELGRIKYSGVGTSTPKATHIKSDAS